MASVFLRLLPLIVGAAVVPLWIGIVLVLLRGRSGLGRASAFLAGDIAARLVQGLVFAPLVAAQVVLPVARRGQGPVVSTLLLVAGILMWITALKLYLDADPDAPPPRWLALIDRLSTLEAFGIGALLLVMGGKQWIFTLSALGVIGAAGLRAPERAIAYGAYVLGATSLMLAPLVVRIVAPRRSSAWLERAASWLERNNRPIVAVVSMVFGTFFLWRGIGGLLGM